jgi:hypothetical protein
VLGPRRAELLDPEVRLLGDLLYYGLTLWAGTWARSLDMWTSRYAGIYRHADI